MEGLVFTLMYPLTQMLNIKYESKHP